MTMTTRPQDETVAELVELLDDNLQEMFQERAAIRTEAGGCSVELGEALALADVVNRYPDALSGVIAFTVEYDDATHWIVTTDEDLAREHIARKKGAERAKRSLASTIDEDFGGLAEITAVG